MSLNSLFRQHWQQPALMDMTGDTPTVWTFAQLYQSASHLAQAAMPQTPGAIVAFSADNRLHTVLTYVAGWIAGHTLLPLDATAPPAVQSAMAALARPTHWLPAEAFPAVGGMPGPTPDNDPPNAPNPLLFGLDDAGCPVLFLTSGTTQTPKVVVHRMDHMLANVAAFNRVLPHAPCPMVHVMPLHYMAGVLNTVLAPWAAGQPVVLAPVFSPDVVMRLDLMLAAVPVAGNLAGPLAIWLSPTMLSMISRLIKTPARRQALTDRLGPVLVGTAPLSASVKQAFESTFQRPCWPSYGMSEVLLVSVDTGHGHTVGQLLPGIQAKTAADGQLWLRSAYAMAGYQQPDGTLATPMDPEGWLPTGDLGAVVDGALTITGRQKDVIIRGGINISPTAVEAVLLSHPAIAGAAVMGQPDPFWGETVHAWVECLPDNDTNANLVAALQQHCQQQLPAHAIPTRIEVVTTLHRTSTGKVQKHLLRQVDPV
jgi:acyl-CoA synthetase (AMP-forming)/AMP-acid ligase II